MAPKSVRFDLDLHHRIIAISDIHGHTELFDRLLDEVGLRPDDHLVLIGDYINKGPDSMGMIRRLQDLTSRPNTYLLKGNHETFIDRCLKDPLLAHRFLTFLREDRFHTVVHDWLKTEGISLSDLLTGHDLNQALVPTYGPTLDFLMDLPAIAFCDDLVFVHGGYDGNLDVLKDDEALLKYDDFNRLSKKQTQRIIVGHWPTANLRSGVNTNTPYFNYAKNIISIDGGIGVKTSGELNALIIEKTQEGYVYDYHQVNPFTPVKVVEAYSFHNEDKIFVNYPHFDLELLKRGDKMSLCRHIESGKELSVFNCLITSETNSHRVKTTYINHFVDVRPGDEVLLVKSFDDCSLVKHQDEFGWLYNRQIGLKKTQDGCKINIQ